MCQRGIIGRIALARRLELTHHVQIRRSKVVRDFNQPRCCYPLCCILLIICPHIASPESPGRMVFRVFCVVILEPFMYPVAFPATSLMCCVCMWAQEICLN